MSCCPLRWCADVMSPFRCHLISSSNCTAEKRVARYGAQSGPKAEFVQIAVNLIDWTPLESKLYDDCCPGDGQMWRKASHTLCTSIAWHDLLIAYGSCKRFIEPVIDFSNWFRVRPVEQLSFCTHGALEMQRASREDSLRDQLVSFAYQSRSTHRTRNGHQLDSTHFCRTAWVRMVRLG